MPLLVEFKVKLCQYVGRKIILSKAYALATEHHSLREVDTYFFSENGGGEFKIKQIDNMRNYERSSMIINYRKDMLDHGVSYRNFNIDTIEGKQVKDVIYEMYANTDNVFRGFIEKFREEFLIVRDGLAAKIIVDSVKGLGDFFQVKIAIIRPDMADAAKWLGKRICEEFNISQRDYIESPRCYNDLLTQSQFELQTTQVNVAREHRAAEELKENEKAEMKVKYEKLLKNEKRRRIQQQRLRQLRKQKRQRATRLRLQEQADGKEH